MSLSFLTGHHSKLRRQSQQGLNPLRSSGQAKEIDISTRILHLVVNLQIGLFVPLQYHVFNDDTFSTVFINGTSSDDLWDSILLSKTSKLQDAEETTLIWFLLFGGFPTILLS